VTLKTLYRKWAAYREGDLDGLLERRGGHNRGRTTLPEDCWDYFMYIYLDDRKLPVTECYKLTLAWTSEYYPELLDTMPGERTFRRQLEAIEPAVVALGRSGEKAYDDRAAPYINRLYNALRANDYWIADNHTWDIFSQKDGAQTRHRLHLTAFTDARSGVIAGWNLTDNPCSQSTLLALRHAILRFGIPHKVYFDNGSEFLTHDLAGRGHRKRKSQSLIDDPPPILKRLGVEMTNAIVRNAKAKPRERTFGTLKGCISRMFPTFTGGNVLERPESLKYTLKKGEIPLDSQLRDWIADMLDGIYNVGEYGGAVKADHGKRRIDVWNESVRAAGIRKAAPEELDLLLMRSTRRQRVGRNGVYVTVQGEKLEYWDGDTWQIFGTEVYVRYDPADLATVRVYDAATDKYLRTVPMATSTLLLFDAPREEIAVSMADIRRVKRAVWDKLEDYQTRLPEAQRIDMLDMQVRRARSGKTGFAIEEPKIIIPVRADEPREEYAKAVGAKTAVIIDMKRMNEAAERRRRG
jgi:hypothetical protein